MLPEDQIGMGGMPISLICLKDMLRREKVTFRCSVRIEDVTEEGVVISGADGSRETLPCDTVILSLGFRPNRERFRDFEGIADGLPADW